MPERESTSPIIKKSQHELRKQYVEDWETKFNLLQDKLVDKNGNLLIGAALISRKASILRKLEFKDAEKLPTFAQIIENQKAESQKELENIIKEIAPELATQTDTIRSRFRQFLFTFSWTTRLRQVAVGALIIGASYLGARFYFEQQYSLDSKIALVQNKEEPPTPTPQPLALEKKIVPPTPISEKENPPQLQKTDIEPVREPPVAIVTIPTPEVPPEPQEKSIEENIDKQEITAVEQSKNIEPIETKINFNPKIAFPVGINYPLPKEYVPQLAKLADYKNIKVYGPKINTEEGKGEPEMAQNLSNLFRDAQAAGINDLVVTSCYRNSATQKYLYEQAIKNYGPNQTGSAAPEHTEHRTGLACDLTTKSIGYAVDSSAGFEKTPAFYWLLENAHKYGFIMTYTKAGVDGRIYESWHWRYVGKDPAYYLFKNLYFTDPALNTIAFLASLNQSPQQIAMAH